MVVGGSPEVLAVVPARGGSKSLPRKNLRLLDGHPLIAYAIAAATEAPTISRLIVSTDDEEIADVGRRYGAEVPFLRPAKLAEDSTPDLPVFQHALQWLEDSEGYRPDIVVQLRPTSPLRPRRKVEEAVRMLLASSGADCVRGVTPSMQNPFKMWKAGVDGFLTPLLATEFPEPYNMPRQALPATYWQTGHVDAVRTSSILEKGSLTGEHVLPLLFDSAYCVDIDSQHDLDLASWLLRDGRIDVVRPPASMVWSPLPREVALIALDFDGVFTDDRVWIDQDGIESVVCSRRDGLGLEKLKAAGYRVVVLSKEKNPVVARRCEKLQLPCHQGIDDKSAFLGELVSSLGISLADVVFVGNDINDVECLSLAGCGVAVGDAHPSAKAVARIVLERNGGRGAIRELAEMLLAKSNPGNPDDG